MVFGRSVDGLPVIISLIDREVTLPCSYRNIFFSDEEVDIKQEEEPSEEHIVSAPDRIKTGDMIENCDESYGITACNEHSKDESKDCEIKDDLGFDSSKEITSEIDASSEIQKASNVKPSVDEGAPGQAFPLPVEDANEPKRAEAVACLINSNVLIGTSSGLEEGGDASNELVPLHQPQPQLQHQTQHQPPPK